MRTRISIALLGAAAMAVALGACAKDDQGTSNPESVKQAIQADQAKWNKQFKDKDTEALVGHYADDAFLVGPGFAGVEGSTPIRQIYADASTDPAFGIQLDVAKVDVSKSGDMAYARGKFTEKYTDKKTGKVMTDSGSYLTVYKKQDDGSWKAEEDFAAADPDSTKPVPPAKPAVRAKMTSFG